MLLLTTVPCIRAVPRRTFDLIFRCMILVSLAQVALLHTFMQEMLSVGSRLTDMGGSRVPLLTSISPPLGLRCMQLIRLLSRPLSLKIESLELEDTSDVLLTKQYALPLAPKLSINCFFVVLTDPRWQTTPRTAEAPLFAQFVSIPVVSLAGVVSWKWSPTCATVCMILFMFLAPFALVHLPITRTPLPLVTSLDIVPKSPRRFRAGVHGNAPLTLWRKRLESNDTA